MSISESTHPEHFLIGGITQLAKSSIDPALAIRSIRMLIAEYDALMAERRDSSDLNRKPSNTDCQTMGNHEDNSHGIEIHKSNV